LKCTQSCKFDQFQEHANHDCGQTTCHHKCELCTEYCRVKDHFHQEAINSAKPDVIGFHSCGNDHPCKNDCAALGVCKIDYNQIEKVIENDITQIKYIYFEPFGFKQQCKKKISSDKKTHSGSCWCELEHRCNSKCPECGSFCMYKYGHTGEHHSEIHKNKEHQRFVSLNRKDEIEIKIKLKDQTAKHKFQVGDSCVPENCKDSCNRKGRAHQHLKLCEGGGKCAELLYPGRVFHSYERYKPFEDQVFDLWYCREFWMSYNWKMPSNEATHHLCNFYCTKCGLNDDEVPISFCKLEVGHSGKHKKECDHEKLNNSYQVAFCMDSTGSMGSYLKQAKSTITKIVDQLRAISTAATIQFAFVDYKDHRDIYVVNSKDFSDPEAIIAHISKLEAGGGEDLPEAMFDGLKRVTELRWNNFVNKYVFLIADAPPHGREFFNRGITRYIPKTTTTKTKTGLPTEAKPKSGVFGMSDFLFSKKRIEAEVSKDKPSTIEEKTPEPEITEEEIGDIISHGDSFPDGCPCGIKLSELTEKFKKLDLSFHFLIIGSYCNQTDKIFKKNFGVQYKSRNIDNSEAFELAVLEIMESEL